MKTTKRILLLTSNFPPVRGGSASVYAALATEQPEIVRVLAPLTDYNSGLKLLGWREHDRSASYRVRRIPLLRTTLVNQPPSIRGRLWRLWDLKIRVRVIYEIARSVLLDQVRAVCIGELVASGWILKILRWIPGIRTAVYVHGEEITTHCRNQPERSRIISQLQCSDVIIVVSGFTLDETVKLVGAKLLDKITLISNGVDTKRFYPAARSDCLVSKYGLEDCFIFVSISRLVERKGQDNTIAAMPLLLQSFPNVKLIIVGNGPYKPHLTNLVMSLSLTDQVIFTGQVSDQDLLPHYLLGDVFIMPNRELDDGDTEGFGLVFLEANACGLPVIAGKDGGSVEAVTDGQNGLVVDGKSVYSIADAMARLCDDVVLRKRLSENGIDRAQKSGWSERSRSFLTACLNER